MPHHTVVVLEPGYADYATERQTLQDYSLDVVPITEGTDAISLLSELNPVAILVRERSVQRQEIEACPNLKIIVRYGVGVDNVDLAFARENGIYVANVPDYGAEHEVSDHAVALYLAVQRHIVRRDKDVRSGQWGIAQRQPIPGRRVAILGVVGFGRIAKAAIRKFLALGFETVLVHDPVVDQSLIRDFGAIPVSLSKLCSNADVLTLHAPLTEATRNMIGQKELALMKPSTILINVSRGGLVEESALAEALTTERIFGAGLDVFSLEPPDATNRLLQLDNVVLSDHTAWYSEDSVRQLQTLAAGEIGRVMNGKQPRNWVNSWS